MSETVTHFGKLKKAIIPEDISLEDFCKEIIIKRNSGTLPELKSWQNNYTEYLLWEYEQYLLVNNSLFILIEDIEVDESGYFSMTKNADDTISYYGSYYNGGTSLSECLEEGIKKLESSNEDSILF